MSVKKNVKTKILPILLVITILMSCIPCIGHALSYGEKVSVSHSGWVSGMYYDFVGYKQDITNGKYAQYQKYSADGNKVVYCIQLGTDFVGTSSATPQQTISSLTQTQRNYVIAAMIYGYQGTTRYGKSADIERCATQAVLWAIQLDAFNKDDANFLSHAFVTSGGHLGNCSTANANAAKEVYNKIKEQVLSHYTIPSFTVSNDSWAETKNITLKWDGSKYSASVTDTNGVLANYDFSMSGVTFTKSGNTLNISTSKTLNNSVVSGKRNSSKYIKNLPAISTGFMSETNQDTCVGINIDDPVPAYFSLTTENVGTCIIVKQDTETGKQIPLSGFGFKIKSVATNKEISIDGKNVFYTNNEGKITLSKALDYGNYQLIEVNAAGEYVLDSTPVSFTVNSDSVTVVKKNISQKGVINITKQGSAFTSVTQENGTYKPIYSTIGLSDTTFEIIAAEDIVTGDGTIRYKEGDVVQKITTNSEGKAVSNSLYLGKYNVKETVVKEGYILDTKVYPVELKYAGQNTTVTSSSVSITNERQKVSISLTKEMECDNLYEIGIGNEIANVVFGLYAAEQITARDGKTIPKNGLIEKVNVNLDGTAKFNSDLPFGKYYVKEIATDEAYVLSGEKYDVDFSYTDNKTPVVEIEINGGNPIVNEIIRGKVEGLKKDSDGFEVGGALIGLFKEDENTFTKDTALAVCYSNQIGVFVFDDIAYGNYLVKEIESPAGFVLNDTAYPVTIDKDGAVIKIEIVNEFLTGTVEVIKVDAENHDNKLSGAVFEVYVDVDANKEFDPTIDKLVGEMAESDTGIYCMGELKYNGYFVHEKDAPEGYVPDSNYYYFEIRNDNETVVISNISVEDGENAEKVFENKPIIGNIEIIKTDAVTGEPLEGAGFRIKNENGDIIAEGYTDKNGIVKFTLHYGKYTYEEFDAPEGYQLDTEVYTFEVTEHDKTIEINMKNEPIPTPVTGAEIDIGAVVITIVAAICIAGGIVYLINKRKKK